VWVKSRFIAVSMFLTGVVGCTEAMAELDYSLREVNGSRVLIVSGEFSAHEQLQRFDVAVNSYRPNIVSFDSAGGSVVNAMALGRRIRALGLDTVQIRQLECASACSLAFLGGVNRGAAPGSIGVHRSSFDPSSTLNRDDAVATVQALTAEIIAYLSEMGVSPELLTFAYRYDQNDMRYLSAGEMHELRVTTSHSQMAAPVPTPPASAPVQSRSSEADAYTFVRSLIEEHGAGSDSALQVVSRTYAPSLSYYGQRRSLSEVLSDKKSYFARWPERAYRIRADTVDITCIGNRCTVSGVYDWAVRSTPRNRQANGAAQFLYELELGPVPRVLGEAGFVLK
jgi:hypothetical protein